ncbi:uncharacterized protein TEOVI_000863300 [Trypanosoma equiperdum]|uniref:Trypanosomal VSG domain containing protein n=1 Tax=Trypanosoma equiperdum TaxID=5694 RepID=A0A1G4I509_TRYEQ|nr:hypothetical protein TEOVI_000863300 [Trypanosoma equiperdum]
MQKAAILAVALFAAAETLPRQATAVNAGHNIAYGAILFQALPLGDDHVTFKTPLAYIPNPPLEICKLNMSLADPALRKRFEPEPDGIKEKAKPKRTENFPIEREDKSNVLADA